MCSDLLQVLVQRVDPEQVGEGDGLVVDAILSIDTDRPSLKPLYRSALQVRGVGYSADVASSDGCRRRIEFDTIL